MYDYSWHSAEGDGQCSNNEEEEMGRRRWEAYRLDNGVCQEVPQTGSWWETGEYVDFTMVIIYVIYKQVYCVNHNRAYR